VCERNTIEDGEAFAKVRKKTSSSHLGDLVTSNNFARRAAPVCELAQPTARLLGTL
jgi:hypothetical protein